MRAFVTSVSGTGNLGSWPDASGQTGLAAGDAICQARARPAGLEPAQGFRAWLSDSSDDAYCRIHGLSGKKAALCGQATLPVDAGPWVRTDGYPFAPKLVDMLAPRFGVYTPARFDEMGNEIPGTARYFTGTLETGEGQSYFCGDWTIGDGSSVGWSGRTSWTGSVWTVWSGTISGKECGAPSRLLCLEIGPGAPLPPFTESGLAVFVTSTSQQVAASGSASAESAVTAGDAICQALALGAALAHADRFKAWLSTPATPAAERLTNDGPWLRLDGVRVAASKADLVAGKPVFSPINLTETGEYMHGAVTIGFVQTSATCGDPTNNNQGVAVAGDAMDTETWASGLGVGCSGSGNRLYCFED